MELYKVVHERVMWYLDAIDDVGEHTVGHLFLHFCPRHPRPQNLSTVAECYKSAQHIGHKDSFIHVTWFVDTCGMCELEEEARSAYYNGRAVCVETRCRQGHLYLCGTAGIKHSCSPPNEWEQHTVEMRHSSKCIFHGNAPFKQGNAPFKLGWRITSICCSNEPRNEHKQARCSTPKHCLNPET